MPQNNLLQKGLIFSSDRGSHYASHEFRRLLEKHAVMESFFHALKTELVCFEKYRTRSEPRQSIFEYIEIFYNCIRRHSYLGYISPVDFGKLSMAT